MLNDTLANALSLVVNAEKIGKDFCIIKPTSKIIEKVLEIMNNRGYVGKFEKSPSVGGEELKLFLIGKVNVCGAIKPRSSLKYEDIEKFEKRFLPAKDFGFLLISTPHGIITNEEAKKKKIGGVMLAYCY